MQGRGFSFMFLDCIWFLECIWHIQAFSLEIKNFNLANNSNQIKEIKTLQYTLSGTE